MEKSSKFYNITIIKKAERKKLFFLYFTPGMITYYYYFFIHVFLSSNTHVCVAGKNTCDLYLYVFFLSNVLHN